MMEAATKLLFLVSVYCFLGVELVFANTNPQDAAALGSLKSQWQNVPLSWGKNEKDPCGAHWTGVTCRNSSVTSIELSSMNLTGTLTADIGNLSHLQTLILENVNLNGAVPQALFRLPQLKQVKLKRNQFNNLDMNTSIGSQLQLVDIQDNQITTFVPSSEYNHTLLLGGNKVCDKTEYRDYCRPQELELAKSYSTSIARCVPKECPSNMKVDPPQDCGCALPFSGTMYFRAPFLHDLSNATVFEELETSLCTKFELSNCSVFLQNPFLNASNYIQIELYLFPTTAPYFNRTEIERLQFCISKNQTFNDFGPYNFTASPYEIPDGIPKTPRKDPRISKTSSSLGLILGIVSGCVLLIVILVLVRIYVVRRAKKADKMTENSESLAFAASCDPRDKHSQESPQLKGARCFSFAELKKCTKNFLDSNEIGSGGYGKVYRGILSSGQVVAVKRAQHGSMQGGLEFKTEIEILSRVRHENLVSLLGFCSEHGEQMLVYEFVTNMSLRDSLAGRSGIYLDWKRRLRIALDSARGLAYLHEHANPPIIHRDVKSTNIFLDDQLTAKIADFGLSKLVQDTTRVHVTTQVKGTMGYLDPEYHLTNQLTEKSDVYSFGVVMLEIVTSKPPIDTGKYTVREVLLKLDNDKQHHGLEELMDPTLKNEAKLVGFGRFIELAVQCVAESAADRPTMSDVVKKIAAILHDDRLNTNSPSLASSAINSTSFGGSHPYNDVLPRKT